MEKETLEFIVKRFDNLYSASNIKGSFLIAYNTFICGGIFASYKDLVSLINPINSTSVHWIKILLFIVIILSALSIVLTCLAIIPFLKSGNSSKNNYHSLFFFGSVAEYSPKEYESIINTKTQDDVNSDLSLQACILAKGLKRKYNLLFGASWIIPIQIIFMAIILAIVMLFS